MANEVMDLIKDFINSSNKEEISIDEIFENFKDFDPERNRVDVLRVLRALEATGAGCVAIGRRGRCTRFIKGAIRVKLNIPNEMQAAMDKVISEMNTDDALVFQKNGDLTINDNIAYHSDNRAQIIECLKTYAENGQGKFIIGRRGSISRFIRKVVQKPEVEIKKAENNDPQIRYNIINDILFKTTNGEFSSIEEALKDNEELNIPALKEELNKFGYVKLS